MYYLASRKFHETIFPNFTRFCHKTQQQPCPPAPIRTSLSCACSVRSIASEARRWSASTIYCSSSCGRWKWSQKHIINYDNDSYDMFQFSKDLNFQISNHDMFQFSKDFKRSINSEVEFFFFNIDNGQPLFLLLVLLFKNNWNMGFIGFLQFLLQ